MFIDDESFGSAPLSSARDTASELWRALLGGEFSLHYQPQVDLHSGAITALEALIRWNHPSKGLLLPGAFIPLAEANGLIGVIDGWVLETACRQADRWNRRCGTAIPVAVNVSALELMAGGLERRVERALAGSGLPPALLEIELTESVPLLDTPQVERTLLGLKRLGVALAIDDFGAGHAGLEYLERLPADKLKLDTCWMARSADGVCSGTRLSAVVEQARGRGMRVTAEGVEDASSLARARGLGCHEAQGWFLAKPMPLEALLRTLNDKQAVRTLESRTLGEGGETRRGFGEVAFLAGSTGALESGY